MLSCNCLGYFGVNELALFDLQMLHHCPVWTILEACETELCNGFFVGASLAT